jgi:hypothetical protein
MILIGLFSVACTTIPHPLSEAGSSSEGFHLRPQKSTDYVVHTKLRMIAGKVLPEVIDTEITYSQLISVAGSIATIERSPKTYINTLMKDPGLLKANILTSQVYYPVGLYVDFGRRTFGVVTTFKYEREVNKFLRGEIEGASTLADLTDDEVEAIVENRQPVENDLLWMTYGFLTEESLVYNENTVFGTNKYFHAFRRELRFNVEYNIETLPEEKSVRLTMTGHSIGEPGLGFNLSAALSNTLELKKFLYTETVVNQSKDPVVQIYMSEDE